MITQYDVELVHAIEEFTGMYLYVCVCVYMYDQVYVSILMNVCIDTYVYTYMHICVETITCQKIVLNIYISIYMYINL
jgi:hypothetical protein